MLALTIDVWPTWSSLLRAEIIFPFCFFSPQDSMQQCLHTVKLAQERHTSELNGGTADNLCQMGGESGYLLFDPSCICCLTVGSNMNAKHDDTVSITLEFQPQRAPCIQTNHVHKVTSACIHTHTFKFVHTFSRSVLVSVDCVAENGKWLLECMQT